MRLAGLREPAVAVYAFVFVANLNLTGFFALAPTFRDAFDLGTVETSLLFTATGVVLVVFALPFGMLADRVGSRRVTVAAAALMVASSVSHALAFDLATLLVARVVFGIAFLGMLTAGIAWLAESSREHRRARAIAGIMPVAGAGALVGPFLAGALADAWGVGAGYGVLAACGAAAFGLVVASNRAAERQPQTPSLTSIARAARVGVVAAAAALMALAIVVDVTVNLLAPLQLDDNGLSAAEIGAVLSVASGVYLIGSFVSYRHTGRIVTLRGAGISSLLCAVALLPLMLSSSSVAQSTGVIASRLSLSVAFVIALPLGALGAHAAGIGLGAANGLIMLALGAANAVAPVAGAVLATALEERWVYVAVAVLAVAAGVWILLASREDAVQDVSTAPAASG